MWSDHPVTSTQAINALNLHHEHFKMLVDIGIISPIAYGADGKPRFSANKVEQLKHASERLVHVIAIHFPEQHRRRFHISQFEEPPPPYYPYDNAWQAAWARRLEKMPHGAWRSREDWREISRVHTLNRQAAVKAYNCDLYFDPDAGVRAVAKMTREQLYGLVWEKPMDPVAIDIGVSETRLRQLCLDCCIPTPGRGYFNFQDPVDRPPRTPLPKFPRRRADRGLPDGRAGCRI